MPILKKEVLHKVTAAIFRATGAPDDLAVQVADVLVDNHLAGHDSASCAFRNMFKACGPERSSPRLDRECSKRARPAPWSAETGLSGK